MYCVKLTHLFNVKNEINFIIVCLLPPLNIEGMRFPRGTKESNYI